MKKTTEIRRAILVIKGSLQLSQNCEFLNSKCR